MKDNLLLWSYGLFKIPMILYVGARVVERTESRCVVRIPLNYRTKNHYGAMYFGALCVGADLAGGTIAVRAIHDSKKRVGFVFKDFQAEFLKRPEGDVDFVCHQGQEILESIQKAIASGERENIPLAIEAFVPKSETPQEPVARFRLVISVKLKGK